MKNEVRLGLTEKGYQKRLRISKAVNWSLKLLQRSQNHIQRNQNHEQISLWFSVTVACWSGSTDVQVNINLALMNRGFSSLYIIPYL